MLQDIWDLGGLSDTPVGMEHIETDLAINRHYSGWKRIGLEVEETLNPDGLGPFLEVELFRDTGELGLDCLVRCL